MAKADALAKNMSKWSNPSGGKIDSNLANTFAEQFAKGFSEE
jgi:hypothetical protein